MPTGAEPLQLVTGDLNGDTFPDVVTVNQQGDTVSVLINSRGLDPQTTINGVSFAPAVDLPAGDNPKSLALDDLDRDTGADLDIAVLSAPTSGSPVVNILRNDLNQGTQLAFVTADSRPAGTGSLGVLVSDVDNNGQRDLITVNRTSLRGPGNGVRVTLNANAWNNGTVPCAADFNNADGATVQDIYDYLYDWNRGINGLPGDTGNPDFNNADGVTVQDIYDFLAAWNYGCD
jgi:hypothetical protein